HGRPVFLTPDPHPTGAPTMIATTAAPFATATSLDGYDPRPAETAEDNRRVRDVEAAAFGAAPGPTEEPISVRRLARPAGYAHSGHFRDAVAGLLDTGFLVRVRGGVRQAKNSTLTRHVQHIAETTNVEVFILVDANGDFAVGLDAAEAREAYESAVQAL